MLFVLSSWKQEIFWRKWGYNFPNKKNDFSADNIIFFSGTVTGGKNLDLSAYISA